MPCRDDLAAVADAYFRRLGMAVEIGATRGDFAAKNLAKWSGRYVIVVDADDPPRIATMCTKPLAHWLK